MLKAVYDEKTGVVVTTSSGMTAPEEVDAHIQNIQIQRERQRARTGRFLHLVDLREGAVQTQASTEKLSVMIKTDTGVSPDDKTAVVLNSALMKLQVARLTSQQRARTFDDFNEALAWLTSKDD